MANAGSQARRTWPHRGLDRTGAAVGTRMDRRGRRRIAAARMTGQGSWRHDCGMDDLPAPLAWLVDEAGASPGPDRFLAELGSRLLADRLPLAGGALTLAVPHPIIARRTWLWRGETGTVIEALGFAGGPLSRAGRDWLGELGPGPEDP